MPPAHLRRWERSHTYKKKYLKPVVQHDRKVTEEKERVKTSVEPAHGILQSKTDSLHFLSVGNFKDSNIFLVNVACFFSFSQ